MEELLTCFIVLAFILIRLSIYDAALDLHALDSKTVNPFLSNGDIRSNQVKITDAIPTYQNNQSVKDETNQISQLSIQNITLKRTKAHSSKSLNILSYRQDTSYTGFLSYVYNHMGVIRGYSQGSVHLSTISSTSFKTTQVTTDRKIPFKADHQTYMKACYGK